MPRTCTICSHAQRATIEAAIVAGTPYRDIALHFSVGHMSVARHADGHIQEAIKHAQEAKDEAQALDVVKQLKVINTVTLAILTEARTAKENGLALSAVDRVMKQLELQAKLLGDLDDAPTVNVWLPAPWADIEAAILSSLTSYPDARVAVASALLQLEEGGRAKLN